MPLLMMLAGLIFSLSALFAFPAQTGDRPAGAAAFQFADVKYFHRFTQNDQHEYTPAGQENLEAWTEMITLQLYRKATNGEALAATANAVLENYRANKAVIVKTASVPRAANKPAEHLIVAVFSRPKFIEAVFARFRMREGVGSAVIYSHRIYGANVGNAMQAWLEKNGVTTEKNVMNWDAAIKLPAPK